MKGMRCWFPGPRRAARADPAQHSPSQKKGLRMGGPQKSRPHLIMKRAHRLGVRGRALAWMEPPRETMPVTRLAVSGMWRSSTPAWIVK